MPEKITGKIADKAASKLSEVVRAGVKTSVLGSILLLASCSSEPEMDMTRCMTPTESYQKYIASRHEGYEAAAAVETSYRYARRPDRRHAIYAVRVPDLERPFLFVADDYDNPLGGGGVLRLINIQSRMITVLTALPLIQGFSAWLTGRRTGLRRR